MQKPHIREWGNICSAPYSARDNEEASSAHTINHTTAKLHLEAILLDIIHAYSYFIKLVGRQQNGVHQKALISDMQGSGLVALNMFDTA